MVQETRYYKGPEQNNILFIKNYSEETLQADEVP